MQQLRRLKKTCPRTKCLASQWQGSTVGGLPGRALIRSLLLLNISPPRSLSSRLQLHPPTAASQGGGVPNAVRALSAFSGIPVASSERSSRVKVKGSDGLLSSPFLCRAACLTRSYHICDFCRCPAGGAIHLAPKAVKSVLFLSRFPPPEMVQNLQVCARCEGETVATCVWERACVHQLRSKPRS